jgi:hypothetical protein
MKGKWSRLVSNLAVASILVWSIAGCDFNGSDEAEDAENGTGQDTSADDLDASGGDASGVIERCGRRTPGEAAADAGPDASRADGFGGDVEGVSDTLSSGRDTGVSSPMLPEDFTFDSEYEMRFTEFEFTESSPGYNANILLQDFLDQSREYPIIVLLHLDNVDPEKGTTDLRGGAGLKVDTKCDPAASDCEYKWDPMSPESYREVELNPETGELRGGLEKLDFIGTVPQENDETEKFTIPIRDIYFHDAYLEPTEDGVAVTGGRVEGYVTREAAEESIVRLNSAGEGTPVADLLYQDGKNPVRYDADGDGEADSWCLSAEFSAEETTIVSD